MLSSKVRAVPFFGSRSSRLGRRAVRGIAAAYPILPDLRMGGCPCLISLAAERAGNGGAAMTTKEFVSLEKSLLPEFPGFAVKGR